MSGPAAGNGDAEAGGWEYRFTAAEPRLSEHVRDFEDLGFEVRLEPVDRADMPDASCSSCLAGAGVYAIYVRPVSRRT